MLTGLVLGGGGARGAYEAGVLLYLRHELGLELGRRLPFDVLTGTSVGAINACHLAAGLTEGPLQAVRLAELWRQLKLEAVLRIGLLDALRFFPAALGAGSAAGLVDSRGLESLVVRSISWRDITHAIHEGRLRALAVSATHVASGRTHVFVQTRPEARPCWRPDPHSRCEPTRIGPNHALASAAIPLLFPAVRVAGQLFVDGGLRQNVPLGPALRLGAQRVIVISLRHLESTPEGENEPDTTAEENVGSAPFLVGKTLNALLLDRTEQDLQRLRRINTLLSVGTEALGPEYVTALNRALLPRGEHPLRYVRNILVRPSRDIGELASEYARSREFALRARGVAGKALRALADREGRGSADLVSYLLFDGGFADRLIQLGRQDARALRAEWLRFWTDEPHSGDEVAERRLA